MGITDLNISQIFDFRITVIKIGRKKQSLLVMGELNYELNLDQIKPSGQWTLRTQKIAKLLPTNSIQRRAKNMVFGSQKL